MSKLKLVICDVENCSQPVHRVVQLEGEDRELCMRHYRAATGPDCCIDGCPRAIYAYTRINEKDRTVLTRAELAQVTETGRIGVCERHYRRHRHGPHPWNASSPANAKERDTPISTRVAREDRDVIEAKLEGQGKALYTWLAELVESQARRFREERSAT